MLALEVVLAESDPPAVFVFDELDAGIIALGLGVSMFVIMKWLETTSIEDYEDGRYKPSGLEE